MDTVILQCGDRQFSSNAAPKRSSGCGFVLTYVMPLREAPSAQCVRLLIHNNNTACGSADSRGASMTG